MMLQVSCGLASKMIYLKVLVIRQSENKVKSTILPTHPYITQ